ncbi:MAG: aminotransferase class V-fold PLP-dependent enzyme, partial [Elusimicrobia bacterium]|nr:aminotransferase class V-fold PLP-dependent enzyme [Elusimicrobiota bacterium]
MKKNCNSFFLSLKNYAGWERHSFHTPGHKAGQAFEKNFRKILQEKIFEFDITVTPFVDSIHEPKSVIKNLQEGICALYGVNKSFILVNGSTQGNLAAFLSLFKDGDTVLISRNIHMSVISACVISGIYPSWMNPPILKNGVIGEVSAKDVQNYINYYPEAKGVFITSPTYNGIITELEKIAEICHKEKKLLIVDEAWGPHLQFWKKEYSAVNFA